MAASKEPWGRHVLVEFEDRIAWVYFNRPEKRNAMSPALNEEMRATVEALASDARCGVFVLSGKGDAFTAGMDLHEYFRATEARPDTERLMIQRIAEEWQWRWLRTYPKPTIAMVNGWCFGGGFTPLGACDLAVAAEEAQFGLSDVNWGIVPAGNAPKAAIELMGYRQALYYAMTGETFDGRRAAETGLVNEAVPRSRLEQRVRELARALLEKEPSALRGTKVSMKRIRDMDWDTSADYLYAKNAEAIHLGGGAVRNDAMKSFLDDKTFRPGLESFRRPAD